MELLYSLWEPISLSWHDAPARSGALCYTDFMLLWKDVPESQRAKPAEIRASLRGHRRQAEEVIRRRMQPACQAAVGLYRPGRPPYIPCGHPTKSGDLLCGTHERRRPLGLGDAPIAIEVAQRIVERARQTKPQKRKQEPPPAQTF